MKGILILFFSIAIGFSAMCQTFKLTDIACDKATETHISYYYPLSSDAAKTQIVSLWGYQRYGNSWEDNCYEVEYYKGSPKEMIDFLTQLVKFAETYQNENNIVTYISGVRVMQVKLWMFKGTVVYDKENKVRVSLTLDNLKKWLEASKKYFDENKILYQ